MGLLAVSVRGTLSQQAVTPAGHGRARLVRGDRPASHSAFRSTRLRRRSGCPRGSSTSSRCERTGGTVSRYTLLDEVRDGDTDLQVNTSTYTSPACGKPFGRNSIEAVPGSSTGSTRSAGEQCTRGLAGSLVAPAVSSAARRRLRRAPGWPLPAWGWPWLSRTSCVRAVTGSPCCPQRCSWPPCWPRQPLAVLDNRLLGAAAPRGKGRAAAPGIPRPFDRARQPRAVQQPAAPRPGSAAPVTDRSGRC